MNKSTPTIGRILVIAGFSLSCFGLLLFLWLAFGGPIPLKPEGYRFKVAFPDATTLAEQADVRTAGVSIGKVVAKDLAPEGNRTLATIELQEKYAPLHEDARAILRQKTLLGETYVEMTTGSRSTPTVPENGRLKDGQVAQAVEFDELLRIFDDKTRRSFREWQAVTADATRGRGRDFNDALGNFPVFTENAQDVVDVLNRRRQALGSLVRNTGTTFAAITRNEDALQTLIRRNADVFQTLADKRESLAETFQIFPTFLRESRFTLNRLRTFSQNTEPLVRDLEPVLQDVQPTLASLQRLSPDLEALFEDLDPLIAAGRTGLPAMARVLRGLDPTLASFGPFLQQLNPILNYLEFNQVKISDFLSTSSGALSGIRATTAGSKSNGHVLPQIIMTGDQSLPSPTRSVENRGNAYPQATAVPDPKFLTIPAFDCPGGERIATRETPGCLVAGKIPFPNEALGKSFPQVQPAGPGGVGPADNAR